MRYVLTSRTCTCMVGCSFDLARRCGDRWSLSGILTYELESVGTCDFSSVTTRIGRDRAVNTVLCMRPSAAAGLTGQYAPDHAQPCCPPSSPQRTRAAPLQLRQLRSALSGRPGVTAAPEFSSSCLDAMPPAVHVTPCIYALLCLVRLTTRAHLIVDSNLLASLSCRM